MSLYTCRRVDSGYRVVKFDGDINVTAVYDIEQTARYMYCSCPAGNRWTCRHREMIHLFQAGRGVDTGKFLEYDTGKWKRPLRIGARA